MNQATDNISVWVYVQAWAGFMLGGVAAAISMQANSAILTGDCAARGLSPMVAVALIMLPVVGGLLSYRIARVNQHNVGLYIVSRIGADFCIFIIALILMHLGYTTFFWNCRS